MSDDSRLRLGTIIKGPVLPEPIKILSVEKVGDARKIEGEGLDSGNWHQIVLSESDLRNLAAVRFPISPGSDADLRDYSGKLVHCGAALNETFQILEYYVESGEEWRTVREAVLERNLLGKGSTQRARHVAEAIKRRFISSASWLPPPQAVTRFGRLQIPERAKGQVVLAYIAAEDQLFHDVLCSVLAEKRDGEPAPRKTAIRDFTRNLLLAISPPVTWSSSMETRWAEGLLAVLRQVGLIDGLNPGVFRVPNLRVEAFAFLFLWLHESLGSTRRSIGHSVFDPFFLKTERVLELLEEGRQRGWWGYTEGFGMLEMTPKPPRLEDWMDELEAKEV